MTESTLFLVVVAVATIVLVFVVALPDPRRGALIGEAEALVRFSATAAIAVLSTALLYLADESASSRVALAVGDGMMVLAAWMTWSALRAVNGRARLAPLLSVAVATSSTAVSLLIPETPATSVKLVVVAVGCVLSGAESLVGRVRATPVYGVFAGVGFGYGGYVLARVAVITFLGTDSPVYERAFETAVSTLLSALAVIAATVGAVLLFRAIEARPAGRATPAMAASIAEQVLAQGRSLVVYRLEVADIDLVRRAHGVAAAQAVRDALVESAASQLPSVVLTLAPQGGHLTIVEAERRGAPSAAAGLARAFDAAIERVGLADLAEVDVERITVRSAGELAFALGRVSDESRRRGDAVGPPAEALA